MGALKGIIFNLIKLAKKMKPTKLLTTLLTAAFRTRMKVSAKYALKITSLMKIEPNVSP